MEAERKNLYEKIAAVASDVKNISKNLTVGTGSYSYKAVSDLDVTLKVKEAERKHRIVSIPTKQQLIHHEVIRTLDKDKESLKYSFLIKMTTKFVDLDNPESFIEIDSFGHGLDNGDKGFGKASTYARKYALLNAYKIATGEDPDSEPSKKITTAKTISNKRKAVENVCRSNNQAMQIVLNRFGIERVEDIPEKNIEYQYDAWVKSGHIKE